MRNKIIFIILILIIPSIVLSGEKQTRSLTGNRTIDFFGSSTNTIQLSSLNHPPLSQVKEQRFDEDEKSPWLAGLLSLVVPGAGEVYSESYVKGAIFFGVEVGSWITRIIYDKKGDDQTTLYENYANQHYSVVRYAQWMANYFSVDTSIYKIFRYTPTEYCRPPFPCINWNELNRAEQTIGGFTHQMPYYNQQQYYELIGKYKQFSKGWDSQDPILHPEAYADSFVKGNPQFYMYGEMFNKADKYYKVADAFLSVIIVNHILSALDAAWSATRYNKSLHASVRMQMHETPYGYLPGAEAHLRYTF